MYVRESIKMQALVLVLMTALQATWAQDGCRTTGQFKCSNRKCISFNNVCDGHDDCEDNSDEVLCGSKSTWTSPAYFVCNNGMRLSSLFRCDGSPHCGDGSDEKGCPIGACTAVSYMCDNGRCIYGSEVDDNSDECRDESDVRYSKLLKGKNRTSPFALRCGTSSQNPVNECDGYTNCADGSDERGCPTHSTCYKYQLTCDRGKTCVNGNLLCNGKVDCGDGADEVRCNGTRCRSDEHRCGSGLCFKREAVCDGVRHCMDGSDEWGCSSAHTCPPCYFTCANGFCIHETKRCDGMVDCADSSDEWRCGNFKMHEDCVDTVPLKPNRTECNEDEFRCLSGECISLIMKCDYSYDCSDYSDETVCKKDMYLVTVLRLQIESNLWDQWLSENLTESKNNLYVQSQNFISMVKNFLSELKSEITARLPTRSINGTVNSNNSTVEANKSVASGRSDTIVIVCVLLAVITIILHIISLCRKDNKQQKHVPPAKYTKKSALDI